MAKSSGHFKKAKANSEAHNSRKEVPNYLLPSEYRTPNGRGSEFIKYHDPKELFEQELAKKNATKTRGKRPKFENSVWEIEVNCNEVHTLEDGQKLAKDLEHLLSYTCCSVALHRDEGHMVKDKEDNYKAIHNYHFHLVFETYKDGIQYARQEHNKGIFKNELQDVIAKSLSMDRGETQKDREKRIAAKLKISLEEVKQQQGEKYKQYCERLDQIAQEKGIEDFNARLEIRPRKHIDSSEYRRVAQELENTKTLTREEVEQLFKEQLQNTQITISNLETEKSALESQNQTLEQQNSEDKKTISKLTENNTVLSNEKQSLNSELLTLKQQKEQIEAERKKYKDDGDHLAEEYRKLQALNKTKHTQEELDKALAELRQQYEERIKSKDKEITDLKEEKTVLSNEKTELETTIQTNKQTNEKQITEITDNFNEVIGKQSEDYNNLKTDYDTLYSITSTYVDAFKAIGTECQVTFNDGEDFATYIEKVKDSVHNTVLSNSQKPKEIVKTVEVVKEVSREITTSEVEKHPRFLALELEKDNLVKYYENLLKPDMSNLTFNFLTVGDFENLKPRDTEKTNFLGRPIKETPAQVIERFNKVLERRNEDVKLNYLKIKHNNTVLSKKVKQLETENNELKSWKEIGIDLLHNFGFYIEEKIPSIEEVKSTVKSFASRLFSAFMMNNDHDLDYVQNKIVDGQEYKQKQIDKQQQKEQAKQQQQIEQQVDQALGFGAKPNANKDKEEQAQDRGGWSR